VSDTVVADSPTFHYVPPLAAHGAQRVIVKPNLGYPVPAPVTVGLPVLREVLLGIRRVAPQAEIVILEGVCTKVTFAEVMARLGVNRLLAELADPGLRLLDADTLPHRAYSTIPPASRSGLLGCRPRRFWKKPTAGYPWPVSNGRHSRDARSSAPPSKISTVSFRAPSITPAVPHARGQLHVPDVQRVLVDVYFTLGVRFEGAVVDLTHKFISRDWQPDEGTAVAVGRVVAGTDLLDVDLRAVELAGEPCSDYFQIIARQRQGG
jgi:hypothetical protein